MRSWAHWDKHLWFGVTVTYNMTCDGCKFPGFCDETLGQLVVYENLILTGNLIYGQCLGCKWVQARDKICFCAPLDSLQWWHPLSSSVLIIGVLCFQSPLPTCYHSFQIVCLWSLFLTKLSVILAGYGGNSRLILRSFDRQVQLVPA